MKCRKLLIIRRILVFVIMLVSNLIWNKTFANDRVDHKSIRNIISKMTLDQKAKLLIGTGMFMDLPDSIMKMFGSHKEESRDTVYTNMVTRIRKYLPGAAGTTAEFPEMGIASQVLTDGPAGLRIQAKRKGEAKTYYCTAFPIATMLASTWDTELVYRVGQAMGNEVKEYGSDILLAPALNIQRDPLCGRNFEYYSEDPLIAGKIAAAMVNGIQSNGVGTSVKHFAANNSETNRMSVNTVVSERALREIYLKGFEIVVKEASPWTVMSSYNKINGIYTSESQDLLTKILRNDWGFKGYVMTDWGGGSDVVAQMNAGNDLIMPGQPKQIRDLIDAVKEGRLSQEVIDQNLSRILNIMLRAPRFNDYKYSNTPDLKAHAAITRQAATDGMVLLKNTSNALPIPASAKKIAAFGNTSYEFIAGGTGSGDVNKAYTISLSEGLTNNGFIPDNELTKTYEIYIKDARSKQGKPKNWLAALMGGKDPVPEMAVSPVLAKKMAEQADMALITIGRISGEGSDRTVTEGDFYLSSMEKEMITNVSYAFHKLGKKVVVILNTGGVIETATWRETPDAVVLVWQPGQEAGNSVVDVISGKVNPSGKLAVSFPISYADAPTAKNFPGVELKSSTVDKTADLSGFSFMRRVPWEIVYEEDIYVGYRYYNTFKVPVAFEFGYGLSYTDFGISNLILNTTDFMKQLAVSVEVKNTGTVAGKEVVQLYISSPSGKMKKPEETLAAFGKTRLLQPGESQKVSFDIDAKDFASFDETTSSWVVEAGDYNLKIGTSSLNIKQMADFKVARPIVVGKVSKVLLPNREIHKLTADR